MTPADLLARAGEVGFTLAATDDGWAWVPICEGAFMPPSLLADLKRHRAELIAHLTCAVCRGQTYDARHLQMLASEAFCDRANCPRKRKS